MSERTFGDSDLAHFVVRSRSVLLATVLLVAVLAFVISLSGSFTFFDFSYMAGGGAALALAAMGQALVVLSGGFDLSAGAVISLVNVTVGSTMGDTLESQVLSLLLGVAIGASVGAVNGFFVAYLRMQSIVVTLSTLFVVQGLALFVQEQPGGYIPQSVIDFFAGTAIPGVLPAPLVVVAVALVIWLLLKNTRFGTALYAVGSDAAAAASAGINVRLTKFLAYVAAGVYYAAAGIFISAQTGGSDPLVGQSMLLQIFTAVVLGGTMLGGGRGGLVGPVIGAYLLMLFVNVLLILDVPAYYSPMVDGAILILAVLFGASNTGSDSLLANLRDLARRWSARGRAPQRPLAPTVPQGVDLFAGTTWFGRNRETIRSVLPSYVALAVILIGTAIYFGGIGPGYFGPLLVLSAFLAVLAFGQGTVILTGGLDLSIPWTIALCGVVYAQVVQGSNEVALWATPMVLGIGILVGLANGLGITVLGLPPMVMTLGANGILQGIALVYAQGAPLGFAPPAVRWITTGSLFGVVPIIYLLVIFAIIATLVLAITPLGRRIYAVGNSVRVAYLPASTCVQPHRRLCHQRPVLGDRRHTARRVQRAGKFRHGRRLPAAVDCRGRGRRHADYRRQGPLRRHDGRRAAAHGTADSPRRHVPPYAARGIIQGLVVLGALVALQEEKTA